jgi:hypothetical protein
MRRLTTSGAPTRGQAGGLLLIASTHAIAAGSAYEIDAAGMAVGGAGVDTWVWLWWRRSRWRRGQGWALVQTVTGRQVACGVASPTTACQTTSPARPIVENTLLSTWQGGPELLGDDNRGIGLIYPRIYAASVASGGPVKRCFCAEFGDHRAFLCIPCRSRQFDGSTATVGLFVH